MIKIKQIFVRIVFEMNTTGINKEKTFLTMVMVLIACFGFYYIRKHYGCKYQSHPRTSQANLTTSCTHTVSQPYGQTPVSTVTQPVAFYAMLPPNAPPNHNINSGPSAIQHNIVT